MISNNRNNCNKNTNAINRGDIIMNMHKRVKGNLKNRLMKRERTIVLSLLLVVGVLSLNFNTHAIVGPIAKGIVKEILEFIGEKGGKEVLESVGKKVSKEAMEELAEKTIKEVGEEGAKKVFKELGEQALKHGDDAFLVARKYGVQQTVHLLKELPEETGKKAVKAFLNRGDELMPLAQRFGKEVIEMEVKHPGLTKQVAVEFGEQGIKSLKNCDTNQIITLLRRKDILNNLTPEGKAVLCQKVSQSSTWNNIVDIFEKHPKTTDALVKLSAILGSVYIISEKALSSDIKKVLPDGRVVDEEVSIFQNRDITYNQDGSMVESNRDPITNLFKKIADSGKNIGIHYLVIFIGAGIGLFFVLRGLVPIVISLRKKNNV